jgi:membrane protease YdiL (CAAX protease family)
VKQVQETVELFQNTTDISVLVLMAFTAVIVAPICEEMVFRGYIYPALSKFTGPWIGWIISALVFSAAHGSMSALVPLFIFGLALVLLYEWTGSIWAPIAVHLLFNGATVAVQLLDRFGYIPEKALE